MNAPKLSGTAALRANLERLDNKLLEIASKTSEEQLTPEQIHSQALDRWRATMHATAVKCTSEIARIRRQAERKRMRLKECPYDAAVDASAETESEG